MFIVIDDSSEAVYCWNHALERGFALHFTDGNVWAWFDDTGRLLRRVIAGAC